MSKLSVIRSLLANVRTPPVRGYPATTLLIAERPFAERHAFGYHTGYSARFDSAVDVAEALLSEARHADYTQP